LLFSHKRLNNEYKKLYTFYNNCHDKIWLNKLNLSPISNSHSQFKMLWLFWNIFFRTVCNRQCMLAVCLEHIYGPNQKRENKNQFENLELNSWWVTMKMIEKTNLLCFCILHGFSVCNYTWFLHDRSFENSIIYVF
jgi:hypothetical protein